VSGAEPFVGREAIRRMYADVFPRLKSFRGEASEIHVSASGDVAWETGRTFSTRSDPADAKESSGKYLLVWRKDRDGVWRIAACAATANPKPSP
jgi:ketosteroid isomerase-like protein